MPKATLKKNIMAISFCISPSHITSTVTLFVYKIEKELINFLPVVVSPPHGIALHLPG